MKKKVIVILMLFCMTIESLPVRVKANETSNPNTSTTADNSNSDSSQDSNDNFWDNLLNSIRGKVDTIDNETTNLNNKTNTSLSNEGALAEGQQALYQATVGTGGYSNTDVYAAINDVTKKKKLISEYMNLKYLTEQDLLNIKGAMYLSQFIEPLNGNLLNVAEKLLAADSTGEVSLSDEISSGSTDVKTSMKDICNYIKNNYFVTKLYVADGNSGYRVATVKDLKNIDECGTIYLKDTTLLASDIEVTTETLKKNLTSEASTTNSDGIVTVNGLQTGSALSRISDKSKTAWLPFLDKNIRSSSTSTEISNINLNQVDTYIPILNNTLTTKAALTIQINDYLRYNPNFKMSNFNSTFGSKQLGMDSFGNFVCYDDGLLIMNVMMNPIIMSNNYYEKLNLTAYNIKCYYSTLGVSDITPNSDGIYGVVAQKGVKINNASTKWTTAIMDEKPYGKERDAIFVLDIYANGKNNTFSDSTTGYKTNSIMNMGTAKLPSGEKQPYYHLYKISSAFRLGVTLQSANITSTVNQDIKTKLKVKTNDGTEDEISMSFKSALVYTQGENAKDTRGAIEKWFYGSNVYEYDGRFQWYYVNLINSNCLYTGDSNGYGKSSYFKGVNGDTYYQDFFGYRKKIFTFYKDDKDKDKMYSGYGYITRNMTSNNGGTQTAVYLPNLKKITSAEIVEFTKMYMGTGILNNINIFKNWDKYRKYTLKYIKQANNEALNLDLSRTSNSYTYPNDALSSDDKLKDVVILGVGIYGELYKDIPLKDSLLIVETGTAKDGVVQSVDFNNLLLSIVKNTNQTSKRLDSMTELSTESAEEMKQAKVNDIIAKVYELLNNFVYTCQKFFGGCLQLAHIGMSSSSIKSLFYITGDDLQYWTSTLVQKLLAFSMIVLVIKIVISLFKMLLNKKYRIWDFVKMFYVTVFLMTVPLICLNLSIQLIGALSDGIMRLPTMKYATVTLQQSIKNNVPKEIAADENKDKVTEYFIEHFDKSYESSISIQELDTEHIEGFSDIDNLVRKNLDLGTVTTLISSIPNDNDDSHKYVYDGSTFVTALGEHYDKSSFYYFLDYYINLWCQLNQKSYENMDNWQTQLEKDMFTTRSLESYFSKRSIVYGQTASMPNTSIKLSDIFGLGTLFYDDGSSPQRRGYYLPIEIMDSRLVNDTFTGTTTDNMYWSYVLKDESMQALKANQKEKLPDATQSAPVYAFNVLNIVRTKINKTTVLPRIIAGQDVFKKNNFNESNALDLEKKLWVLNQNIYKRVCEYYDIVADDTITDFTDVIQLAALSSFEFDKQFNVYGDLPWAKEKVLQTSYVKEKMDFDMILKSIFKSDKQVTEDFDLMYELVLDGFGIIPAILLVVAEFMLMLYLTLRIFHLGEIYIMGTIVCSLAYGWRSNQRNKAYVGIGFQCFYFIFTHIVVIGSIAAITLAPVPKSNFSKTLLAFVLAIGGIVGIYLELKQMIFVLKNAKDLGGQVVADKVSAMNAQIRGKLEGVLGSDNTELKSDSTTSIENPNEAIEDKTSDNNDSSLLKSQNEYASRMLGDTETKLDGESEQRSLYNKEQSNSEDLLSNSNTDTEDIDDQDEDLNSYDNARDIDYDPNEDIHSGYSSDMNSGLGNSFAQSYDSEIPIASDGTNKEQSNITSESMTSNINYNFNTFNNEYNTENETNNDVDNNNSMLSLNNLTNANQNVASNQNVSNKNVNVNNVNTTDDGSDD